MAENKPSQSKGNESELTLEQAKDQLLEMGKKRGVLAYEEIADRLSNFVIESDQMDEFYDYLGEQGVEIIGESEDDPNMQQIAKEEEFNLNDLSVPLGIKINDPVRMYLKEIGRVDLLSAAEEIDLATRIEKGEEEAKRRLAEANLRLVVSIAKDMLVVGCFSLILFKKVTWDLLKL